MPKMKTHRGAAKRFKLTGKGKIKRMAAFKSHLLEKKSSAKKRGFDKLHDLSPKDAKRVKRMLSI